MRPPDVSDESGVCSYCHENCTVEISDEGVGDDDAGGARINHHDWQRVSSCCGEPLMSEDGLRQLEIDEDNEEDDE